MKRIKEFLKCECWKETLSVPKGCVTIEQLCNYVRGVLSMKERERIESHLAKCCRCLDMVTSIHDGSNFYYKRRFKMKKENLFLIMAVVCFVSSFIFSRYFLQFLAATIILGIKWIVDSKTSRMLVMIYDAWKRGGEREAGRILKDIKIRVKGGEKDDARYKDRSDKTT